jgi:acyl-CoA thioesterase
MTVTDGTYTPLFVPNWTEKISLQMVPRVFHVTLKVDSLKADSLEIYLAVGRGVNQWSLLGEKKVIIKNGEYSFGWNTSIVSFDSMDVVTFVFQFRTSQSSETYGVVKVEESTTGVVNQQVIPKNFTLSQNYPNPFNPTTKIQFSLTSRSNVKLVVLNLIGQEVKTLVNEEKGQGNYEVSFDASKFSSGHGAATYSLLDAAFELAVNSHGTVAVALSVNVNYLNAALPGETLQAEARETNLSRKISACEIRITGQDARLVATAQALAYRKKDSLPFL